MPAEALRVHVTDDAPIPAATELATPKIADIPAATTAKPAMHLITQPEFFEQAHVSKSTGHRLLAAGKIGPKPIRLGGCIRFNSEEVSCWLLFASAKQAETLAPRIVRRFREETGAIDLQAKVIELVERLLLLRFPEYDREAMRMKFNLHDIKESRVWQEANTEGKWSERQDTVRKCLAKGMTEKQIGDLLEISIQEVRKLANGHLR